MHLKNIKHMEKLDIYHALTPFSMKTNHEAQTFCESDLTVEKLSHEKKPQKTMKAKKCQVSVIIGCSSCLLYLVNLYIYHGASVVQW